MTAGAAILDALAARRHVPHRVMLVAAHPDDETIGCGAQLCRFDDLILVHLTDGAPRDGRDAANYGFASVRDYAAARRNELDAALAAGEATARRIAFDIADQACHRDLAGLTRRIGELLQAERPVAVITHAYEGGHPDHDAAAFAVHAACGLIAAPPAILEMALYHREDGRRVSGKFLEAANDPSAALRERVPERGTRGRVRVSDGEMPSPVRGLSPAATLSRGAGEGQQVERRFALNTSERERKQRMIDAFATQRWLLVQLDGSVERLRVAPDYDFRRPPHSGTLHYETIGWDITGATWCAHAGAALTELGLEHLPCR